MFTVSIKNPIVVINSVLTLDDSLLYSGLIYVFSEFTIRKSCSYRQSKFIVNLNAYFNIIPNSNFFVIVFTDTIVCCKYYKN